MLISFEIVILFVLICIEKYHNFERNEDRTTVFLNQGLATLEGGSEGALAPPEFWGSE